MTEVVQSKRSNRYLAVIVDGVVKLVDLVKLQFSSEENLRIPTNDTSLCFTAYQPSLFYSDNSIKSVQFSPSDDQLIIVKTQEVIVIKLNDLSIQTISVSRQILSPLYLEFNFHEPSLNHQQTINFQLISAVRDPSSKHLSLVQVTNISRLEESEEPGKGLAGTLFEMMAGSTEAGGAFIESITSDTQTLEQNLQRQLLGYSIVRAIPSSKPARNEVLLQAFKF